LLISDLAHGNKDYITGTAEKNNTMNGVFSLKKQIWFFLYIWDEYFKFDIKY
jgi:hypothetical protein